MLACMLVPSPASAIKKPTRNPIPKMHAANMAKAPGLAIVFVCSIALLHYIG